MHAMEIALVLQLTKMMMMIIMAVRASCYFIEQRHFSRSRRRVQSVGVDTLNWESKWIFRERMKEREREWEGSVVVVYPDDLFIGAVVEV
jgi:hypothetical protein